MKRSVLFVLLLVMILSSGLLTAIGKAPAAKKQSATIVFHEPFKLLNVVLQKGEYLFVHDDALMAGGGDCTFVYSLKGNGRKLVASFHCTPVLRDKARSFTVRTERVTPDAIEEFREFQFAGSTQSHLVPLK